MPDQANPTSGRVLRDPVLFAAFGFGAGLSPLAPGTAGTLVAVPIHLLLVGLLSWYWHIAVVALITLLGIELCGAAVRRLGVHDHRGIVWDEIAGYLITMLGAPPGWQGVAAGFLLFRLFDVSKPWPIRLVDRRLGGGIGVMLDDVLAGCYAGILLWLAGRYGILPLSWLSGP